MSHLIGIKGATRGPVVNRVLICINDACPGIIEKPDGMKEVVKFGQIHYSTAPAPCCTYCGVQMAIASMHARQDAHVSKQDKHKLTDKVIEQTFQQAQDNNHRLVEGGRGGDVAKQVVPQETQAYMNQMTTHAQRAGFMTGFNSTAGQRDIGKGFAQETLQQGAVLPMSALSASLGKSSGFWRSRDNVKIQVK